MGDFSDFQKRRDCWCAFGCNICNQTATSLDVLRAAVPQGNDGIHKSWKDIIS